MEGPEHAVGGVVPHRGTLDVGEKSPQKTRFPENISPPPPHLTIIVGFTQGRGVQGEGVFLGNHKNS